jgi:hypothetical protein
MAFSLTIHISPEKRNLKKENWIYFDFGGVSIFLNSQGGGDGERKSHQITILV